MKGTVLNYPHLFGRVFNTPLLIEPRKLETIVGILETKLRSGALGPMPDQGAARQASYEVRDGVAVLPIIGTLVQRSSGMDAMSGMQSYADLGALLQQALVDPKVQAIMLDIDSPGGEVAGLFDFADTVYAARAQKPVWACADELACSAAYAIASAAEKVVVTRTALVGSIGVVLAHVDESGMDAQMGVQYTYIHAGAKKVDGNPHQPLSDGARQDLQSLVDASYALFVKTVARNRALATESVRATEAGVYRGQQAIKAGLADYVGTLDSAMSALRKRANNPQSKSGLVPKENNMSLWDQVKAKLSLPDEQDDDGPEFAGNLLTIQPQTTTEARSIISVSELAPDPRLTEALAEVERLRAERAQAQVSARHEAALVQAEKSITPLLGKKMTPYEGRINMALAATIYELSAQQPDLLVTMPEGPALTLAAAFEQSLGARLDLGLLGDSDVSVHTVLADGEKSKEEEAAAARERRKQYLKMTPLGEKALQLEEGN